MDNELKKKYGLPTAIALVIGIVIGSGVFFKAEKILTATGGNLPLGILAWAIGGLIMIICAYMFSILATLCARQRARRLRRGARRQALRLLHGLVHNVYLLPVDDLRAGMGQRAVSGRAVRV